MRKEYVGGGGGVTTGERERERQTWIKVRHRK